MSEDKSINGEDETSEQGGYVGFIDWLNRILLPVLGPPPVGPYNAVVTRVGEAMCPVCGKPMSDHVIDRSSQETMLNCPVDHIVDPVDEAPLNELGMNRSEN
jgi:hypothetical protein